MQFLADTYGWQPYPQKHFESRLTKFYEGYWLPTKFGFDPRRVQFSSLILTNQMSRQDAIEALSTPAITKDDSRTEFEYVAKKLGISSDELQSYLEAPNKSYKDYRNRASLFNFGAKVLNCLGVERAIKR